MAARRRRCRFVGAGHGLGHESPEMLAGVCHEMAWPAGTRPVMMLAGSLVSLSVLMPALSHKYVFGTAWRSIPPSIRLFMRFTAICAETTVSGTERDQ